ncbi:MAG: hypothetical protein JW776_16175 [Candidatus Lokiarchaeota archaeon]|nr:hypothetical protein [Candidatus Lokiarchaeota archaeon]
MAKQRFATVDFLRGLAIWLMLFIHVLMRWVDREDIANNMSDYSLFVIIFMLAALFLGGWPGFFLLQNAIGNMISMHKNFQRTQKVRQIIFKQIIGGSILLFFAVLCEALIGYKGAIGNWASGNPMWDQIFWRGFHTETIHTVGWCVIYNALIHWILSIKEGFRKVKRNIIIYFVLAIIVVAITPLVYFLAELAVPGYPYATYEFVHIVFGKYRVMEIPIQYGFLGYTPFWKLVYLWFLAPLAGQVEPIFPYLAVSFIGSAIGLFLVKNQQESSEIPTKIPSTRPLTWGMVIGFIMFLIGAMGTIGFAIFDINGAFEAIMSYTYDIRYMYASGVWLFWFLLVVGAQIGATCLIIRLVEFRAKAKPFGRKTLHFRRFGFVPFSLYCFEYVDVTMVLLLSLIPTFPEAIVQNTWGVYHIWPLIILVFVQYELILQIWQRVHFVGSLEWMIAKIAEFVIPLKRKQKDITLPWWRSSKIDVKSALLGPEWINIVTESQMKIHHEKLVDSKLAARLSWVGLLVSPIAPVTLAISRTSRKTEGKNRYNQRAMIISIISILFATVVFFGSMFIYGVSF